MRVPSASPGYLTLVDEVVMITPAVLHITAPSGGVKSVAHILTAVCSKESPGSTAKVPVLLALMRGTLAVDVLGVSVCWAHGVVVTVVHSGSLVPASLVIVVNRHVTLEVGSSRALAEIGGVVGQGRGCSRGGAWARMDDLAGVLPLVASAHAATARSATAGVASTVVASATCVASSAVLSIRLETTSGLPQGADAASLVWVPADVPSHTPLWARMLLTLPDESRASWAVATRGLSSRRAHGDLAAVGGGRNMADSAHALAALVASVVVSSLVSSSAVVSTTAILSPRTLR